MRRARGAGAAGLAIPELRDYDVESSALSLFVDEVEESIRDDNREEANPLTLLEFVEEAWPIIEPRTPFSSNWHIECIADHLTAITNGELSDVLFNIPPGCMKSILVSVMWPAHEWTKRPELRYLTGSYDEALSIRDNRKMRDIVESDWYQARWPLRMKRDQNMKTRFDNEKTGWRIATSVGGHGGTGEHPHRKIIDDPHNVKKSLSDTARKEAVTWFDLTMGSRGLALNAATVVVMQRLHAQDLSGHILDKLGDQFVHVCLPMRYEPPAMVDGVLTPRMAETPIGWVDIRRKKGELLWPAMFDETKLAKLESRLRATHGEFGVAGQLAQRPIPQTGGMFKREWFPIVDAIPADAQVRVRARGWDCAATAGGGDYTAGVRMAMTVGGMVYVEDVVRGQWGPETFEGSAGIFRQVAMLDGPRVRQREEQEPGSAGKKVIRSHVTMLAGLDFKGEPSTGDKATRARPYAAQASVGNVRLVRGAWNQAYIDELCDFPNGAFDDQLDGSGTAFNEIALGPRAVEQRELVEG